MKLTQIPLAELSNYCGLLTVEQAQSLQGQTWQPDSYFNPIQDADGNWIVSVEEIAYCSNPDYLWIKELDMIHFTPKPPTLLPGMTE